MLTVDLRVTSKCNMKCTFCHGAPRGCKDSTPDELLKLILKLKQAGVEKIVFSGGEPTLYDGLLELMQFSKQLGLIVYLSSNCRNHGRWYRDIKDTIDWIGIPLDGSSPFKCQAMSRANWSFDESISFLTYLKQNPPKHGVKVGTVVSRINLNDIMEIGNIISSSEVYRPNIWRLYEFAHRGEGLKSKDIFGISSKQFADITDQATLKFGNLVSPLSNKDHDYSYYFINPNLDIVTAAGQQFPYLGNARTITCEDFKKIFSANTSITKRSEKNRKWIT